MSAVPLPPTPETPSSDDPNVANGNWNAYAGASSMGSMMAPSVAANAVSWENGNGAQQQVQKTAKKFKEGDLVFVPHVANGVSGWMPAMVVPVKELPSDAVSETAASDIIVRYFGANVFGAVKPDFLQPFKPFDPSFQIHTEQFNNRAAISKAVLYQRKIQVPEGFAWPNWGLAGKYWIGPDVKRNESMKIIRNQGSVEVRPIRDASPAFEPSPSPATSTFSGTPQTPGPETTRNPLMEDGPSMSAPAEPIPLAVNGAHRIDRRGSIASAGSNGRGDFEMDGQQAGADQPAAADFNGEADDIDGKYLPPAPPQRRDSYAALPPPPPPFPTQRRDSYTPLPPESYGIPPQMAATVAQMNTPDGTATPSATSQGNASQTNYQRIAPRLEPTALDFDYGALAYASGMNVAGPSNQAMLESAYMNGFMDGNFMGLPLHTMTSLSAEASARATADIFQSLGQAHKAKQQVQLKRSLIRMGKLSDPKMAKRRADLENIVKQHIQSHQSFKVAYALKEIVDHKLYAPEKSIYTYAQNKFQISRRAINTYLCAVSVFDDITKDPSLPVPQNISHIRCLHKFSPEERRDIWRKVCASGVSITEEHVMKIAARHQNGRFIESDDEDVVQPSPSKEGMMPLDDDMPMDMMPSDITAYKEMSLPPPVLHVRDFTTVDTGEPPFMEKEPVVEEQKVEERDETIVEVEPVADVGTTAVVEEAPVRGVEEMEGVVEELAFAEPEVNIEYHIVNDVDVEAEKVPEKTTEEVAPTTLVPQPHVVQPIAHRTLSPPPLTIDTNLPIAKEPSQPSADSNTPTHEAKDDISPDVPLPSPEAGINPNIKERQRLLKTINTQLADMAKILQKLKKRRPPKRNVGATEAWRVEMRGAVKDGSEVRERVRGVIEKVDERRAVLPGIAISGGGEEGSGMVGEGRAVPSISPHYTRSKETNVRRHYEAGGAGGGGGCVGGLG
ncbi:hypothetical protein HDV00_009502 [Rhizophlyctis rosea]|nr:hypothetical protein HDV00_009502 [Rhizophlyctis rosea]